MEYYHLDSIGWGSPFLLVPEATNVDVETLSNLSTAVPEDYYLSNASPLGVPFNNFRKSSSEKLRKSRIQKGKSGSPCLKKYLQSNTEFSVMPICTASTTYQFHKLKQLKNQQLSDEDYKVQVDLIQEKDCLCEGLSEPALKVNHIKHQNDFEAVTICPGPNLAYFSGVFTLKEMIDHIYGRADILNQQHRPNFFVNELDLYIKYITKEKKDEQTSVSDKSEKYFDRFVENITQGINYYRNLGLSMIHLYPDLFNETDKELDRIVLLVLNLKAKENMHVI